MPSAWISSTLLLAGVLALGGVSKFRSPGDVRAALQVLPLPRVVRRPWVATVLPALEAALADAVAVAERAGDGHVGRGRRCRLGEAGAPVAVGMIWTSRVDGDRYWFEIAVDPAFRMRGHGRAMFSQLSSLRAVDKQTAPTVGDWSKDACAALSTFWRPAAWNAPSSTGT